MTTNQHSNAGSTTKKLLVASHNPSKIKRYQNQLTDLSVELLSLKDLGVNLEPPKEDQPTTEEIAKAKAKYYFQKTEMPCFSCDTGLYFEGVLDSEQPSIHVKGIAGATDDMDSEQIYELMVDFYQNLANKYGGQLPGYFLDSYALYDGKQFFVANVKRNITLTNTVHKKDVHFPICSLYKVKDKYYHNLNEAEMKDFLSGSMNGLRQVIKDWVDLG